MSAQQNFGEYTLGPYIMQSVLLLVAPALFAASIYMELGRIVLMVDGERSLFIRRTWLTKLFVAGDVLSFLMQSSGKFSDPIMIHSCTIADRILQAPVSYPVATSTASTWATTSSSPVSSCKSSSSAYSSSQPQFSTLASVNNLPPNATTHPGRST